MNKNIFTFGHKNTGNFKNNFHGIASLKSELN